jgi:mono/diheme cytochrome c family protein
MRHLSLAWPLCVLASILGLPACNDELVERVPSEVCASGMRWAGELTPNEEMYPGQDCVGCHKEYDGPPLLAGGTIYGLLDPDGARTTQNDCFGVEGARVTITSGDGQVLETHTNRAGNFYFEGRESALVKPFRVVVDYTLPDGRVSRQGMASSPSYGGCARCHTPGATPTPGAEPGKDLPPDAVVADVLPIYTGPVHQ